MSEEAPVLTERHGDVLLLRLNIPQRLNPLALPLQKSLREHLASVHADRTVRAVVLTGAGRAFCVGADLTAMKDDDSGRSLGERTAARMEETSNRLIQALRELPVPVLAAVNGPCAGAGVGLALAADVVVAARSAYFYLPFMARLGIVPDLGSAWFLHRSAGRARATAMTLLGERIAAEQAAQWGVIWSCVDDAALETEALALATRLASLPAHAALETRRIFDHAGSHDLLDQLRYEAGRQRELIDRADFAEGVRAFLDKRDPRFPPR